MLPKDHTDDEVPEGWNRSFHFPVLGHIIEHDTSVLMCVNKTLRSAWAAFYANVSKPILKHASMAVKMRRIKSFVLPVVAYRFVRWPFCRTLALRLDRIQRKMISICAGLRRLSDESPEAFNRRRGRHATGIQTEAGTWSSLWERRACGWVQHLHRNTRNASWTAKLSKHTQTSNLNWRRANFGNRPLTRSAPGHICTRWFEGFENFPNAPQP